MANRVNSINGRKYSEDPTVMSWQVANEARCQGCGNAPMQSWCVRAHSLRRGVHLSLTRFALAGSLRCARTSRAWRPTSWSASAMRDSVRQTCVTMAASRADACLPSSDGPDSGRTGLNPGLGGSDWAAKEGQNFVANSQIPCIDYVGLHVWPGVRRGRRACG